MCKYFYFAFIILFFPLSLVSQDKDDSSIKHQETIYLDVLSFHKIKIALPKEYDVNKKYPLIIGLHGRYADAEYGMSLLKQLEVENVIFAAPQGPYQEGEKGKYSWAVSDAEVKGIWTKSKNASLEYIVKMVGELCKMYSIDPKQVFLLGHSQGAAMAYGAGIKNFGLFKGIIILSGWLDPEWITADEIKNAKSLKVFIGHGKNDGVVNFIKATEAKELLTKNGNDVSFYEYAGGHNPQSDEFKVAAGWLIKNISTSFNK